MTVDRANDSGPLQGGCSHTGHRVTFAVDDVPVTSKLLSETSPGLALRRLTDRRAEAWSGDRRMLVSSRYHPVVKAARRAYRDHRPLVLSPDMIWLTIAQGLAAHVAENAEQLRPLFVRHRGKLTLEVERDDLVAGSPSNPWGEVFDAFAAQIRDHIGRAHDLIVSDFSTTGEIERLASEVVLMGTLGSYFDYECDLCGLPSVTLEGTVEDWERIGQRVDALAGFGLSWWVDWLRPVIDQFVKAARGEPERAFWRSIIKVNGGSGGPYIGGWIVNLFPYLYGLQASSRGSPPGYVRNRNPRFAKAYTTEPRDKVTVDGMPNGLSHVPFVWKQVGMPRDYEFIAGIIGVAQDHETMALRPQIGWAVSPARRPR